MAPRSGAPWLRTAATALICAVAAVAAAPAAAQGPAPCEAPLVIAPILRERPPDCWRPYAASSPWNLQIGAGSQLDPRSHALVAEVGTPSHLIAGWADTERDYARPIYFSRPGDPIFTLHCTKPWRECAVNGMQIAIPDDARQAAGDDGHLTVIDPSSGWEYDFWQVTSKPVGGGDMYFSFGGHAQIGGDGLGSDRMGAVAWGGPTQAGLVRAEELEVGAVNHAIFMIVPCDNGTFVYPARHSGQPCPPEQAATAPAMGQRFRLNLTDAQIDALNVPGWKRTLLRAMARYGLIVGDTGGDTGWGIQWESGTQYTSFGKPDEWVNLAEANGITRNADGAYVFNLRNGVDWERDLQVVAPCVSNGTCAPPVPVVAPPEPEVVPPEPVVVPPEPVVVPCDSNGTCPPPPEPVVALCVKSGTCGTRTRTVPAGGKARPEARIARSRGVSSIVKCRVIRRAMLRRVQGQPAAQRRRALRRAHRSQACRRARRALRRR